MVERFRSHIEADFPEMLSERFLLACSGGMDSMVLWDLCAQWGLDFEIAHCNFQLRGNESDCDATFVMEFGEKYGIEVHVKAFDTEVYATSNNVTIQEAARTLRYRYFESLLKKEELEFTVTAHHLDDQLETFLINLSRGSGLEGLCGIPSRTQRVRRPLLGFTRATIETYARAQGLQWREDSSNRETKYLRNRLRQDVIPSLKLADPRFESNFAKSLGFLQGSRSLVRNHLKEVRAAFLEKEGKSIKVSIASLKKLEPLETYLYELFREYGFTDWKALRGLLESSSGKEVLSSTHRLLRDREYLLLRPRKEYSAEGYLVDLKSRKPQTPTGLKVSEVSAMGDFSANVLYLDKETLNEGLYIRKWREGDYFYPLGMKGKQKVSKYFKDHKFSRFAKEAQWLLCSGEDVVWILGHRADDRFKVRTDSQHIIKIEWIDSA